MRARVRRDFGVDFAGLLLASIITMECIADGEACRRVL
jgi:hypothetical protein